MLYQTCRRHSVDILMRFRKRFNADFTFGSQEARTPALKGVFRSLFEQFSRLLVSVDCSAPNELSIFKRMIFFLDEFKGKNGKMPPT